jgi:hypothetical protein
MFRTCFEHALNMFSLIFMIILTFTCYIIIIKHTYMYMFNFICMCTKKICNNLCSNRLKNYVEYA